MAGFERNRILVLGLDPGSRCTGYGVVSEVSGVAELIETGAIRLKPSQDLSFRLGRIFERVSEIITRLKPDEAAVEEVFFARNALSALKLGQARGAAIAACSVNGIGVTGYEPNKVKKSLCGVGRADKSQVAFMVGRILGQKPDWPNDASDALAIAICHLNMRRQARLAGLHS